MEEQDATPETLVDEGDDNQLRGSMVTERLEKDLREQISNGVLKPGDPIKPVRDLMKAYAISYNSVRRTLAQLADEGLLSLEQGRGTFVKGAQEPALPFATEEDPPSVASEVRHEPEGVPASLGVRSVRAWSARKAFAALIPSEGEPTVFGQRHVLEAVQRRVLENGDTLTLVPLDRRNGWPEPASFVEAGVNGVLLFGAISQEALDGYAASDLACVLIDRWPEEANVNAVVMDNFSGAYLLAKELVRAGHREICVLHRTERRGGSRGAVADTNSSEREAACRMALEEDGLVLRENHILWAGLEIEGDELARRVLTLRPTPTGLLAGDMPSAEAVTRGLRSRGVGVPGGFSMACFGATRDPNPQRFTTAEVDCVQMGESAVNRLRQLVAGAPAGRMRINIPTQIRRGRTVAPPRS